MGSRSIGVGVGSGTTSDATASSGIGSDRTNAPAEIDVTTSAPTSEAALRIPRFDTKTTCYGEREFAQICARLLRFVRGYAKTVRTTTSNDRSARRRASTASRRRDHHAALRELDVRAR